MGLRLLLAAASAALALACGGAPGRTVDGLPDESGDAGHDGGTGDAGSDAGASDGGADGGASDGGADAGASDGGSDAGPQPDGGPVIARPYQLHVPRGYRADTPAPLLLMFHGYGGDAAGQERYLGFIPLADEKGFLYAYADGTRDRTARRFWDATDACCNVFGPPVDDVGYAAAIIDDVSSRYAVDSKRIYAFGHSNGGFLVHRLACDLAGRLAGIASLAGATWAQASKCAPAAHVAVLQIHGDADATVRHGGGSLYLFAPPYPGARETVGTWATLNGCTGPVAPVAAAHDLERNLAGAETSVERAPGCAGGAVELWTIKGGGHIPAWQPGWHRPVWDFLAAHPKP